MNLDEFVKKYNGKKVDFDGHYQSQCMDLYRFYVSEVLELPQSPGVSGAYQVFDTASTKDYDKIRNTPSGVPKKGDIIIWQKSYGGYGHIAIVVDANVNGILSFDQNHTGRLDPCQLVNHNYNLVLGWLHPKGGQMDLREIFQGMETIKFKDYGGKKYPGVYVGTPNWETLVLINGGKINKQYMHPNQAISIIKEKEGRIVTLESNVLRTEEEKKSLKKQLGEEKANATSFQEALRKCQKVNDGLSEDLIECDKKLEICQSKKSIWRKLSDIIKKILIKLNWLEE